MAAKNKATKVDRGKLEQIVTGQEAAPYIYTDSIEITTSLYDFKIHLRLHTFKDDKKTILRDLGTVCLSPTHAKMFLEALRGSVEVYEEQFGPILESPDTKK